MPNRIIKESIRTSDSIDQLSWFEECMFYRLIVSCDDYGCMDARAKILASTLFPLKDVRVKAVEDALRKFSTLELVTLYEVDGRPFLRLKTWDRHQRVRDSKHKYPTPEGLIANDGSSQPSAATCGNSPQSAAACGNSPQLAASCGETRQPAARARAESQSQSQSESIYTHTDINPPHETRAREGRWFDPENPDEDCDTGWLSDKGRGAVAQRIMDWACKREGFSTVPEEDEYGQVGLELYAMIAGAMRNGIHPATITKALAGCDGLAACERQVAALIKGQVGIDGLRTISEAWGERAWAEYQAELQSTAAWM